MKIFHSIFLIPMIIFVSCKSEFGKFNDDALAFVTNDKHIDQKEYESLVKQIKVSDEKGFQNLKSEEISEKLSFESARVCSQRFRSEN